MNEKIHEALEQISDRHIEEAANYRRRSFPRWLGAVAALLAVAITCTAIWHGSRPSAPDTSLRDPVVLPSAAPQRPTVTPQEPTDAPQPDRPVLTPLAGLVAQPIYPERVLHPHLPNGGSWKDYDQQYDQPEGYADTLEPFLRESIVSILSGTEGKNEAYSPLNVYMALAMLAEVSDGASRQQLLDLLGCDSIEALRTQAGHTWNAHYRSDGLNASLLANSLWLDSDCPGYVQSTVDALAQRYYASVFRGELGTDEMDEVLRSWLDAQTDGLLKDAVKDVELPSDAVFALASTVYYRAKWREGFNEARNTQDLFHTASGDTTVTYMHRTLERHRYHRGDGYSAIAMGLEDGSRMWLILPDEGSSPQAMLSQGDCLDLILGEEMPYELVDVVLSLPKFDISSKQDLNGQLQQMGITDVFSRATADFSPLVGQRDDVYVSQIEHAARVAIDEEGVTAAAYTVITAPGEGVPLPLEQIEFTLDRPFLFAITSHDDLPLFTGVVGCP